MKRIFLFLISLLAVLPALAQVPQIGVGQLAPRWGFQHTHICTTSAWGCGTNPPTYQVPADGYTPGAVGDGPDMGRHVGCGTTYSTSHARNTDGSLSTKGVRIVLPTAVQMAAAGISAPYRDGQCQINIVMGAPGPGQYLRIAMSGSNTAVPDDKFTVIPGGAADSSNGELILPYRTPGVISFQWNGVSWLLNYATPDVAELFGNGQLMAHGQGRFFFVSSDPTWLTTGTLVGTVAYCPLNGRGTITNSNGGDMLGRIPYGCVFKAATAGTVLEYITVGLTTVATGDGIGQGAAYSGGTAPDGTVYAGGNYVLLKNMTLVNGQSGNTITVFNGKSTLGTIINGNWIYKIVGADIELHEEVTKDGISAPSSFVASDTLDSTKATQVKGYGLFLATAGIGSGRRTWAPNGAEMSGLTASDRTIVGVARRIGGVYQDDAKNRYTASWFNPVQRKCLNNFTADRTTASTSLVEPNSEIRCNFSVLNGGSTFAAQLGDSANTRAVDWTIHAEVSNATNGASCTVAASFDGAAAEPEVAVATQGAATNGQHFMVTLRGSKTGLSEAVTHYLTLQAKASAGTCTIYSTNTTLEAILWQ